MPRPHLLRVGSRHETIKGLVTISILSDGWLVDSKMFKQAFEWIYIVIDVGMHDIVRGTLDQTTQVPSPSICVCISL